jgi:hypothetical protein
VHQAALVVVAMVVTIPLAALELLDKALLAEQALMAVVAVVVLVQ